VLFIREIDLDKSERILAILFGKRFPEHPNVGVTDGPRKTVSVLTRLPEQTIDSIPSASDKVIIVMIES
jgi:hypothetical protein